MFEALRNPEQQAQHNDIKQSQSSFNIHQSGLRQTEVFKPKIELNQIQRTAKILNKPFELRTTSENVIIASLIKQNVILQRLSQEVSLQFVKNILKVATISNPNKNQIIYSKGEKIKHLGIVLTGQLTILSNNDQQNCQNQIKNSHQQIFDSLLQSAKIYSREYKKKLSQQPLSCSKKMRDQSETIQVHFEKIINTQTLSIDQFESNINQNELYGFSDRSTSEIYLRTCVCLNDETNLLIFNEINVMMSLQAAMKDKIKKITSIIKSIPCFNFLDLDKLALVIQSLAIRKKKKSDVIFKQNDKTTNFYLLTEGEIKISKQTRLLQENPNILYSDRKKLVAQNFQTTTKNNLNKLYENNNDKLINNQILPYAKLTTMYNFRPSKKNIEIGVVAPISLFGEQEYIDKKLRQTNAVCSSLQVEYYQINIEKLQTILGIKYLQTFRQKLKAMTRKKLLYRQTQYATAIQLQNNNNMNYFFLQDKQEAVSPRKKYKISKLNNIILNDSKQNIKQQNNDAAFNQFNFHKMKKLSNRLQKLNKTQTKTRQNQRVSLDHDEKKIMEITHTWKLVKEKVDKQIETSNKISPVKFSINLKRPLLGSDYFYKIERQSRRIERDHRKRVSSLSASFNIRNVQQRKNKNFQE